MRTTLHIAAAVTLWTTFSGPAGAQCLQPDDAMHGIAYFDLGAPAEHLAAHGDRILAHYDDQLVLVDANDPRAPFVLGSTTVPASTTGIATDGSHAWLIAEWDQSGLHVVDLQDPGSMAVVGTLGEFVDPEALVVSGDVVYVAERIQGPGIEDTRLGSVDVTDPTNPTLLDEVQFADGKYEPNWIRAGGSLLVVGAEGAVHLIDATDPANLVLASTVPLAFDPADAVFDGSDAILTGAQMVRVDVSDPYAPGAPVAVAGGHGGRTRLQGTIATSQARHASRLVVGDLSNPSVFDELGTLPLPEVGGVAPSAVAYVGDCVVAGARDGLYIADITPALPLVPIESDPGGADSMGDLLIDGSLAYVATEVYGTLSTFDMTDPTAPVLLGSVSTGNEAFSIDKEGDLVAAAFLDWGGPAGIRFVSVANPALPSIESTWASSAGAVYDVSLSAGRAYVSNWDGVYVLDVSDPANPVEVGLIPHSGDPYEWRVPRAVGNLLYLAIEQVGLKIYDVSDPSDIVEVGAWDEESVGAAMEVDGTHVFLGTAGGFRIVDVSDPAAPFPTGFSPTKGGARGMRHRDGFLYVAGVGVEVFDVSHRWQPRPVMDVGTGEGYAHHVALGPDYLWASSSYGLFLTGIPCEPAVSAPEGPPAARPLALDVRPNPFNPQTTIRFELRQPARVTLVIHDLAGRRVRSLVGGEMLGAGPQQRIWDGRDDSGSPVASGVYLARMEAADEVVTRKLALVR